MQIIKTARNRDYMTVANYIARDKRVGLKARGLFYTVMALPEDWDLSILGLSRILREGKDAISTALHQLVEAGYCVMEESRDSSGQFAGTNYIFVEKPRMNNNVQPYPENPDPDYPDPENPPQLNTNSNKEIKELIPSSKANKKDAAEKSRPNKKPSSEVPPAIQAIRQVTARFPDKAVWPLLVAAVGETPDIERLTDCYMRWRAKGFSPTNYSWVTEWYAGTASLDKPPPAAPSAQESETYRLDYPLLIEMQRRLGGPEWHDRQMYEHAKKSWLDEYEARGEEIYDLSVREVAVYETSEEFKRRFPE